MYLVYICILKECCQNYESFNLSFKFHIMFEIDETNLLRKQFRSFSKQHSNTSNQQLPLLGCTNYSREGPYCKEVLEILSHEIPYQLRIDYARLLF